MLTDAQLTFCTAQAMPSGASAPSTNVIDLAIAGKVLAKNDMSLVMFWTGTPAGTNLTISLRSGANAADLTSSPSFHWASGTIVAANYPVAGWAAGAEPFVLRLPQGKYNPNLTGGSSAEGPYKRYLGLWFVGVGDNTAGLLTAYIASDADVHAYAASAFAV